MGLNPSVSAFLLFCFGSGERVGERVGWWVAKWVSSEWVSGRVGRLIGGGVSGWPYYVRQQLFFGPLVFHFIFLIESF